MGASGRTIVVTYLRATGRTRSTNVSLREVDRKETFGEEETGMLCCHASYGGWWEGRCQGKGKRERLNKEDASTHPMHHHTTDMLNNQQVLPGTYPNTSYIHLPSSLSISISRHGRGRHQQRKPLLQHSTNHPLRWITFAYPTFFLLFYPMFNI